MILLSRDPVQLNLLYEQAKEAILEKHNQLRRRVAKGEETGGINSPQPGAANMRKLVRTGELSRLSSHCIAWVLMLLTLDA